MSGALGLSRKAVANNMRHAARSVVCDQLLGCESRLRVRTPLAVQMGLHKVLSVQRLPNHDHSSLP
jgi:hypothetical protein